MNLIPVISIEVVSFFHSREFDGVSLGILSDYFSLRLLVGVFG
jgi:hypothetical protein